MSKIVIEEVTEETLRDAATVSVASWQDAYKEIVDNEFLEELSVDRRFQTYKRTLKDCPFLIAKIDDVVVGICRYVLDPLQNAQDTAELTILNVAPDAERQGVGTALFNYVKEDLVNNGKEKMLACCLKDNVKGVSFLEKQGGKIFTNTITTINNTVYPEVMFTFKLK